jgi:hypothetical protein
MVTSVVENYTSTSSDAVMAEGVTCYSTGG